MRSSTIKEEFHRRQNLNLGRSDADVHGEQSSCVALSAGIGFVTRCTLVYSQGIASYKQLTTDVARMTTSKVYNLFMA